MNPFQDKLPSSSALYIAWNRYAQERAGLEDVTPEVAIISLVDAFLVGKTVFMPQELPSVSGDLRALVRNEAIKSSVATSASSKLGLE